MEEIILKEEYLAKNFMVFLNNVACHFISECGAMMLFTEKSRPKSNKGFFFFFF